MVDVTNESHENPADHQYTVSIDDVTEELMACTCPHHVHRNAFCKHMAAVETATDDGTLDAFPSEDDDDTETVECTCDGLDGFFVEQAAKHSHKIRIGIKNRIPSSS